MTRWMAIGLMMVVLTACAGPGAATRVGYTRVPPTTLVSIEEFRNPGVASLGDGWTLLWLAGDEFYYCIRRENRDWIAQIKAAQIANKAFVVDYLNGGPEGGTGACRSGIEDTYAVLVTGVTVEP